MHAPTVREDTHLLLRRGRSLAKNINLVEGEARYRGTGRGLQGHGRT